MSRCDFILDGLHVQPHQVTVGYGLLSELMQDTSLYYPAVKPETFAFSKTERKTGYVVCTSDRHNDDVRTSDGCTNPGFPTIQCFLCKNNLERTDHSPLVSSWTVNRRLFKVSPRRTRIMESWFRHLGCGPANIPGSVVPVCCCFFLKLHTN